MSVLPLGLAESVREWFHAAASGGGGGTAVETAGQVKTLIKPKRSRTKKKSDVATGTEASDVAVATPDAETPAEQEAGRARRAARASEAATAEHAAGEHAAQPQ